MPDLSANQQADYWAGKTWGSPIYGKVDEIQKHPSVNLSSALTRGGTSISLQGMGNLYAMLRNQGRVDPRLLARAQAQNSRATQQQLDAARAGASRSGMSGGGLNAAMQNAIRSSGASRQANLNYQDIADSYARNQQNIGLIDQLVTRPTIDLAAIGSNQYNADRASKNQQTAGIAGALSSLAGAFV